MSQPTFVTIEQPSNTSPRVAQTTQADHAFPMLGNTSSVIPPNFRFMWAKR